MEKPKLASVSKKTKFKFIRGTEGKVDYLVVGKHAGCLIAFKPLLGAIPAQLEGGLAQMYIGGRIRVVRESLSGDVVEVEDLNAPITEAAISFSEAFPDLKFEQVSHERASLQVGILIPFTPWLWGKSMEALDKVNFFEKAYELFQKHLEEQEFEVSKDDFIQFLSDRFSSDITDLEKGYPQEAPNVNPNVKLLEPQSLFSQMLDPAKAAKEKIHKSGLKVVQPE